jgi:hypothetical protein
VGVTRPELLASDATRKGFTWCDLRATGIMWATRGDGPLVIMPRAGHEDFRTTQLHVREAEAVRNGFGEAFPRPRRASSARTLQELEMRRRSSKRQDKKQNPRR